MIDLLQPVSGNETIGLERGAVRWSEQSKWEILTDIRGVARTVGSGPSHEASTALVLTVTTFVLTFFEDGFGALLFPEPCCGALALARQTD